MSLIKCPNYWEKDTNGMTHICTLLTTIYVHMRGNVDRHSSHDYHDTHRTTTILNLLGRATGLPLPQYLVGFLRMLVLYTTSNHTSGSSGSSRVKIHECVSRTRVTTNVRELWVRLVSGGVMWWQQVWLHPALTHHEFAKTRRRYPRVSTDRMGR